MNSDSRGIKRDKLNGTNGAEFAVFRRISLTFADFRFSWELQHFGGADFRRKPQETADFRRNPFVPFSLSLLVPPYRWELEASDPSKSLSGASTQIQSQAPS